MKEITVATKDSSLFLMIVILSLTGIYDSNSVLRKRWERMGIEVNFHKRTLKAEILLIP